MISSQSRTIKLIGREAFDRLQAAHVLIVGVGGVGGSVFEQLVRCGVGKITAVDADVFDESNLNRQILCTQATIGVSKVQAAFERARSIGNCEVMPIKERFCAQTAAELMADPYDYVADCIDSVPDKLLLIKTAKQLGVPVVSAMGAGNRIACDFTVTDIFQTQNDALARAVRKGLRDCGIKSLTVVCDRGIPAKADGVPGSISYAPNLAGCMMAGHIVRELICTPKPQP